MNYDIRKKLFLEKIRENKWRHEMRNSMNGQLYTRDIEQATSVVCRKKSSILKYAIPIIVVTLLLFAGLCTAQTQFALAVGGAHEDEGKSVALTSDGGYIVTGITESFGSEDLFLLKFNSPGDLTWAKTVGGASWDRGFSVASTPDKGYIVTGMTKSFGAGNFDLFLGKFNSSGDLTWAKTVGGTGWDSGYSVAPTSDGGYIVTGKTGSFGAGYYALFLGKFSSSGELIWVKTVGGTGWDYGNSIAPTPDGGYIVTGYTLSFGAGSYDFFLGKFSSSGEIWDCSFVADCFPTVSRRFLSSISVSPTITTPSLAAVSCSPTVTSPSPVVTVVCTDISETLSKPIPFELTVSPNPFNSSCAITTLTSATVEIFDLNGRLIATPFTPTFGRGVSPKGGHENTSDDEIVPHWGKMSEGQKGVIWQPDETSLAVSILCEQRPMMGNK